MHETPPYKENQGLDPAGAADSRLRSLRLRSFALSSRESAMRSYLRSSLLAERMRVPTAISTIASSTAPIVTSATPTAISIGQAGLSARRSVVTCGPLQS